MLYEVITGDWEFKLKQMERGLLKRDEFMEHIEQVTRDLSYNFV